MGRMYTAAFDGVSIASDATQDLWSIMAASTNKLVLHGWEITSADTAAEIVACRLQRISAQVAGTAAVEIPLDADDPVKTATVVYGDITPGTIITDTILAGYQWEQLGPLGQIYTPEMRPVIDVSTGIALTTSTAVTVTMSGWVCWEEL